MYLGIRHDNKVKERKFTEELEAQRSQVARLTQQLQEERQRASMQIDSIKASAEQERDYIRNSSGAGARAMI